MNVILVMSDSFRRDHIGAFGNTWIHTPHLDRFAAQATVFPHFRMSSYATIPQRTDMLTGRFSYGKRPWQALEADDVTLAQLVRKGCGASTYCSADTPHLFHSGQLTFMRGFDAFHWSRGSEVDLHWTDDYADRAYQPPTGQGAIRISPERYKMLWSQAQRRRDELDWPTAQTFQAAIDWLTHNWRRKQFFLYIDTFDPHEPWDPPQWLVDRYDADYDGRPFTWAEYGSTKQYGRRELKQIRARYAAECTFVDRWFGRLMDTVNLLGLDRSTMVIFLSDHGHYLGYPNDGGQIGKWMGYRKSDGKMATQDADVFMPLLDSVSNPPFMARLPGQDRQRICDELAQPVDVTPTVMEAMKVARPDGMDGVSLMPLLAGRKAKMRDVAVTACHRNLIEISDRQWLYGAWHLKHAPRLFDRRSDPDQKRDVLAGNPAVARRLHDAMIAEMRRLSAPADWLDAIAAKRPG